MSSTQKTSMPEQSLDSALRPQMWGEYIGQEQVKSSVHIILEAAKKRKEVPEHMLFYGPPGVGKTTLAHLIAKTTNSPLKSTSGVAIERAGDLAAIITNLEPNTILFIDEIHQLSHKIEELLYPALESGKLDIILGKGPSARTVELSLPPFMLVGATTRVAKVSGPLRSRFSGGVYQLDFYNDTQIGRILANSAKLLGLTVSDEVLERIASRSRATPRTANALLKRIRDFGEVHEREFSLQLCDDACQLFGVDEYGLTKDDRHYLQTMEQNFRGGPVGVKALAAALHEDMETLEQVYEPFLLRLGFVERSARGRVLSSSGHTYISNKKNTLL